MKILVAIFAYNEDKKLLRTVEKHEEDRNYDLLVYDDGSTDGATDNIKNKNVIILKNERNMGIGFCMQKVFEFCIKNKYEIIVIQAGNDKDNAKEIGRLLNPILRENFDFVQGSRYLPNSKSSLPLLRLIATKYIHPLIFSFFVKIKLTDTTNGFRAMKTSLLRDKRIIWNDESKNSYELEPYLLFQAISLGYKFCEVPVSKVYPSARESYSKMRPFVDWIKILKPVFVLGIKRILCIKP